MLYIGHGTEGADEGGNISCGMEQRRILANEHIGHFPGAIFRLIALFRCVNLGNVVEAKLLSGARVQQWREEAVGRVRYIEGQFLDMSSHSPQGIQSTWLESACFEADADFLEKERSCGGCKVVADEAQSWKSVAVDISEKGISAVLGQPKSQKG